MRALDNYDLRHERGPVKSQDEDCQAAKAPSCGFFQPEDATPKRTPTIMGDTHRASAGRRRAHAKAQAADRPPASFLRDHAMKRMHFLPLVFTWTAMAFAPSVFLPSVSGDEPPELKVGIIGLDTSHAVAFTKVLNDPQAPPEVARCRVTAAYPQGSPDIESSVSRVPGYTEEVRKMGVEIVDSIDELLKRVDCVLLETNDGRPHLEQALPVFKAGKPVFIDKPIAGSLVDAVAIFEEAKKHQTPVFSSSSLRYTEGAQQIRNGAIGRVFGCDAYSPASLEPTHPDLFWYGIHGVETLFTVMGAGCRSVTRVHSEGADVVVGLWSDGRIGSFRGIRQGASGYGGVAFGEKETRQIGPYGGYGPLVVEIVKFFRTRQPPVSAEETLEIYAFMEAADESKRQGGSPVALDDVLDKARQQLMAR